MNNRCRQQLGQPFYRKRRLRRRYRTGEYTEWGANLEIEFSGPDQAAQDRVLCALAEYRGHRSYGGGASPTTLFLFVSRLGLGALPPQEDLDEFVSHFRALPGLVRIERGAVVDSWWSSRLRPVDRTRVQYPVGSPRSE